MLLSSACTLPKGDHDVIGGGQLGRMMIEAGNRIGVRIAILDPGT